MEQAVLSTITLAASAGLLLVAVGIAVNLIRVTGWRMAWSAIAAAMLLVSFQRSIVLYEVLMEGRAPPTDGTLELFTLSFALLLGLGVVLVAPHVVSRNRAEVAVRRSARRFRDLVEGSLQGMIVYRDGEPLFANKAFADIFGYDNAREVMVQSSVSTFLAGHERARCTAVDIKRLRGARVPPRDEFDGVRKDGAPIRLESFATVVDWGGAPAIQATVIDVTERRRCQLAQQDAERQVARANAAKSEFLANVNRELRSPLNAIIGFSQIMESGVLGKVGNDRFAAYASDIRSSGETLLDLVNCALDLTRIEAGRADLEEEDVDVGEVVGECLASLHGRIAGSEVTVEHFLPADLPMLYADPGKLKQILLNTLSHVVGATADGGRVMLEVQAGVGREFEFRVIGSGLPSICGGHAPEETDDLPAEDEAPHSLGIMLAKVLVELHDGALDLRGGPGAGTIAIASFPNSRTVWSSGRGSLSARKLRVAG